MGLLKRQARKASNFTLGSNEVSKQLSKSIDKIMREKYMDNKADIFDNGQSVEEALAQFEDKSKAVLNQWLNPVKRGKFQKNSKWKVLKGKFANQDGVITQSSGGLMNKLLKAKIAEDKRKAKVAKLLEKGDLKNILEHEIDPDVVEERF